MKLAPFYPIIDTRMFAQAGLDPADMARALVRAGVRLAQFRHKDVYSREVFSLAEAVGEILREGGAQFVINDRADIALMLGADGVHVGQDDLPPAAVRRIVGTRMAVGFSTHNEQQLRGADRQPVDYIAIGPIFGTRSKDQPDPVVGLEELARLRSTTSKPLVAIGGITRANARQVLAAGADSVAVIGDLIVDDLDSRMAEWVRLTQGSS